MSWNILAWDDRPADYLEALRDRLHRPGLGITLEIEQEMDTCANRFAQNPSAWDCLILDVVDESDPLRESDNAGVRLAKNIRAIRPNIPIVFVTHDVQALFKDFNDIAPPVLIRPKTYPTTFMTMELKAFLSAQPQLDHVFLIHGRNRGCGNIKEEVKRAIEDGRGIIGPDIVCETLEPDNAMDSMSEALQERIRQCGAVVAICTPDDKIDESMYQPRQNVLLEMGMALGASDGFRRLVILQRWGEDPIYQARLPSDLGGALTIHFYDDHEGPIEEMLRALRKRGVVRRGSEVK